MAKASIRLIKPSDDLLVSAKASPAPGGFILGERDGRHRVELPRELVTRHVLLLGPSGSGKSRCFFMENCARSTAASFVASDPKGELWTAVSGKLSSPSRFAPREPDASECFNWVPWCREPATSLRLARAVVDAAAPDELPGEKPGHDLQIMLAAALFTHAATLDEPTPASAFDLLTGMAPPELLGLLARSSAEAAVRYAAVVALAGDGAVRVAATALATRLVFLADPAVRRFTSAGREAPDFAALRRVPRALFWIVREEDMAALRPLAALFFTTVLHACKAPGAGVPVTFLLDEFANICDVPDFETEITIARGRDIAFVLSLQSISQLERRYGAADAQTIYENCQTTVALPGLSNVSAALIARTLGASATDGGPLTADQVRRLQDNEVLVIVTNRPAMRVRPRRYDEAPDEAATVRLGPARSTAAGERGP